MIDQQKLETQIAEYPVCEYAFIKPEEITFLEQVRDMGPPGPARLQWVLWQNVRNDAASIPEALFLQRWRKYPISKI